MRIPTVSLNDIVVQPEYKIKSRKIVDAIASVESNQIPIIEIFKSYEGEGLWIGQPPVLARVGGCKVGCVTCDTPHSWGLDDSTVLTIDAVYNQIIDVAGQFIDTIAITGGEPSHYPYQTAKLSTMLQNNGFTTWLETSGLLIDHEYFSFFDQISLDIKTPGSDVHMTQEQILKLIDWVKFDSSIHHKGKFQIKAIIDTAADWAWVERNFYPLLTDRSLPPIVLTPAAGKNYSIEHMRAIGDMLLEQVKEYNVRFIPQIHVLLKFR
jgi:organic radical activating enzyme